MERLLNTVLKYIGGSEEVDEATEITNELCGYLVNAKRTHDRCPFSFWKSSQIFYPL